MMRVAWGLVAGVRRIVVLGALVACGMGVLWFSAGGALGAPVALSSFSAGLVEPQAVGVDRVTGDVYVVDVGAQTVDRFDAAGRPVAFSASGSYIYANRLFGTPSESFSFESPSQAQVAVDRSGGPFNGDIYVTNSGDHFVDVFGSDGRFLGQLNGSGTPQHSFVNPCGLAVDSAGRVYVGDGGGFVERYTPSSSGLPVSDGDYEVSEISGVGEACAVAVNAAGDVFASPANFRETGPLSEYEHTQFPAKGSAVGTATLVDEKSQAVAVDPATGRVYVDEGTQIAIYEISGGKPSLVETFGSLSGRSYGVAVGSGEAVYVSDEGASELPSPMVEVFGVPKPSAPAVVSESAAGVSADGAELRAQINPDFADTTYRFQYGATSAYGAEAPVPAVDIGSGGGLAGVQTVAVHLQNLLPGATYHYRVVAVNSFGVVEGSDAVFTTQPAGGSFVLPDGRAWEMVSPVDKNNSLITGIDGLPGAAGAAGGVIQAEEEGNSITFTSQGAFANPAGAPVMVQYLATRGASNWSTVNITPPMRAETSAVVGRGGPYKAFSVDLSKSLFLNTALKYILPNINPPLSEEEPAGYLDYFLRDNHTGVFLPVMTKTNATPGEPPTKFEMEFQGASPDLSHIIISTEAALTSNAVNNGNRNLYDWTNGQLQLVNVLPGETKGTPGAILGENNTANSDGIHPISDDGSKVFFTDNENLYARVNGSSTVQVDASQEKGLESGGGKFQVASSSSGSRVFFLDNQKLTKDSTAEPINKKHDLYEYDFESGHLSDLTVQDPVGADVQGVLGASADGSYVYFVADGVLAPGASRGDCSPNANRETFRFRSCNLYVWHRGASSPTFIATLSGDDNSNRAKDQPNSIEAANDWSTRTANRTARVTSDGLQVVFMSDQILTGYNSTPVVPTDCGYNTEGPEGETVFHPTRCQEVYVYNAGSGVLSCASCKPSGARPTGASFIPGGTQFEVPNAIYQSRVLSAAAGGARVFFDSKDALVPQDVNGKQDVYEWEENGVGTCVQAGGCVSLISSGTSNSESSFADASASGKDVFFLTYSQLVPWDTDNLVDVYDAREGGGLPGPAASLACTGTGCQGVPGAPPIFATPSSETFNGVGNFPGASSKSAAKKKHKARKRPRHKRRAVRHHRAGRGRRHSAARRRGIVR
jgi:hypothetical protein